MNYTSPSDLYEKMSEVFFSNSAYLHGVVYSNNVTQQMKGIRKLSRIHQRQRFDGIVLNTGANRQSAMGIDQYQAYCYDFMLPMRIDKRDKRGLIGIDGRPTPAVG